MDRQLAGISAPLIARFEALNEVRDSALNDSRRIVRISATAVRAAHRGELDEAGQLVEQAQEELAAVIANVASHPALATAGYVQDAMKEVTEATLLLEIVTGAPLSSPARLAVDDAPWLNGLAEAASELRRDTLDALRAGDLPRATALLEAMDAIYGMLVTIDFPDAMTGGLRRSTDALRAVLERTRSDLTMTQTQDRLRQALDAALEQDGQANR